MRVWFNKTFSSLHAAVKLMRAGDIEKRYELVYSAPEPHPPTTSLADATSLEPARMDADTCVQFKREPSNRLRLLEINPRMSRGIGKTVFSGINLPCQGPILASGGALPMPRERVFRSTVVVERNVAEELVA